MRRAVWLGALALLAGVLSCLVDRRASSYACTDDADCAAFDGARRCDTAIGYCVPAPCPDVCNGGCNLIERTCQVECDQPGECGYVACPDGWSCTIACSASDACGDIDCDGARACEITCSSDRACDTIDCGYGDTACAVTCSGFRACRDVHCSDGRCDVACNGSSACRDVECHDACACDVACEDGSCSSAQCSSWSCSEGAGCSSERAGCDSCP